VTPARAEDCRGCAGIVIAIALTVVATFAAAETSRGRVSGIPVGGLVVEGLPDEPLIPDTVLLAVPLYCDSGAVRRAAYAVSKILSDGGYPYNKIAVTVTGADDSAPSAIIRISVTPDERVCMGQPLIVAGHGRTNIYYRDVAFTPGTPYSAGAVDATVRRLMSRPYVKSAVAAPPVIIEDAPPCGDTMPLAVAAISVVEKRGMGAEGALGYESGRGSGAGGLSGRLGLSFVNMLRRGESVDLSYAGTPAAQRLNSAAAYPWAFGLPLELGGSLGAEIEEGGYGYLGGGARASVEIGTRLRFGVSLTASETVPPDSAGNPYTFCGADAFLELKSGQWERGAVVPEFSILTGSGAANREKPYARSKAEAAAGIHYPLYGPCAAAARACAKSLFTEEGYLPPAELYRIGGHGSLRGYSEDEYAFRAAAFSQLELLYYFDRAGSVYIFTDGGLGFNKNNYLSVSEAEKLLGYGIGLRFPSRVGTVSLEWARNIGDKESLGRLHVGVKTGVD
jgi:outer membrane protein assembly factor BamA